MRVLVTVASRHGATREIGTAVAEVLRASGCEVDEVVPDDVEHVTGYDAVVLGSAVYVGRLGAGLRELVKRESARLQEMPVWLFWSGPVGSDPLPSTVPDDVDAVVRATGAREARCFVGRLERAELSLAERAMVALVQAEPGDFRDFDDVEAWAATVAAALRRAPSEA